MKVRNMLRSRQWTGQRHRPRYERDDGPISAATLKQIAEAASASLPAGDPVVRFSLFEQAGDNP